MKGLQTLWKFTPEQIDPRAQTLTGTGLDKCYSLVDMATVHLHLLDDSSELVEKLLVRIQGEQVLFSEQEAEAVPLGPAQAMARWGGHRGDGVLDIHRGGQFS